MDIGKRIKTLRKERGITGYELAKRTNLAVTTLFNIEKGISKNPSWYTICSIAKVLEVPLDELAYKE